MHVQQMIRAAPIKSSLALLLREKLTLSNPHLADDMKEAEGNNAMRPQQEGLLATDGDDEEKCEEQCIPSHQTWRSLNKS